MTDREQAIKDALEAIIAARKSSDSGSGMPMPPETDLPIDPELLQPESDQIDNDDFNIDDPENLLQHQKDTQKQSQQSQDQQGQQSQDQQGQQSQDQQGQQSQDSTNEDNDAYDTAPKFSDDFVAAWNEIIDRFDKDEISDTELQKLLDDIKYDHLHKI